MVQVTNPPTFPFPGSDGLFHVAYNLVLQNASPVPATIRKLEVVDAASPTKVIASFAGKQLRRPHVCLRELQPPARPSRHAGEGHGDPPAAGAGAVRGLHVSLPGGGAEVRDAPPLLRRRPSPVPSKPVPVDYTVTPYGISARGPITIGPPLGQTTGSRSTGAVNRAGPTAARRCPSTATSSPASCSPSTGSGPTTRAPSTRATSPEPELRGLRLADPRRGRRRGDPTLDGQEANAPGVLPATARCWDRSHGEERGRQPHRAEDR